MMFCGCCGCLGGDVCVWGEGGHLPRLGRQDLPMMERVCFVCFFEKKQKTKTKKKVRREEKEKRKKKEKRKRREREERGWS